MKKLVAYFSASGVTKKMAELVAKAAGADTFEIKPKVLYTKKDLDWTNASSRSSVEMKDKSSRPEIAEKLSNMDDYDTVFLGFPIWWYVAPTIINNFLESYDFSNKTVVLFATSGSSDFGKTLTSLKPSCDKSVKLVEGLLLHSVSENAINSWVKSLKF